MDKRKLHYHMTLQVSVNKVCGYPEMLWILDVQDKMRVTVVVEESAAQANQVRNGSVFGREIWNHIYSAFDLPLLIYDKKLIMFTQQTIANPSR